MSSGSESIVTSIREAHRKQYEIIRKDVRHKNLAVHREGLELQPYLFKHEDVKRMAVSLKKKKGITQDFLAELSQALAQNEESARIFLDVDGALQSLCSYLTGGEAALQMEATYCVANLALWEDESKVVSIVAKVFGTYLITLLSSGNPLVQEGCCWALSNMLPQGKTVLLAQDVSKKVCELLNSPSKNVRSSAIQFFSQLITTNSVSEEDLIEIAKAAVKLLHLPEQDINLYWLLFLLSSHHQLDEILLSNSLHLWCLQKLHGELDGERNIIAVIPLIRCLVNWCSIDNCLKTLLMDKKISQVLLQLLKFPYEPVCKEAFLLVATFLNNKNGEVCGMLESIQLYDVLKEPLATVSCLI